MHPEQTTVTFPLVEGRRPTTPAVRGILADAVLDVDPQLAADVVSAPRWRTDYVDLLGRTTAACADSAKSALVMAQAGLTAMRGRLVASAGEHEVPLQEWECAPGAELGALTVRGAAAPVQELEVPYGDTVLRGEALRDQLHRWREHGIVEASFVAAIEEVLDHPEWLGLPGRTVVLLGAGAELSPLGPLSSWGADVLAVDVAVPAVAERLRLIADRGAGTTTMPVSATGVAGADLLTQTGELLGWLEQQDLGERPVVGTYAYADGGAHVAVTAAADALAQRLAATRPEVGLAFIATPTDAFVVPADVVEAGVRAYRERGAVRWAQAPLRAVSRGRLFAPNYARVLADGTGVADILVPQQGPNYAMAKRLQRWQGVVAEDAGRQVSFNVAPATWTRSVTKNRLLAAAYGGARHFGVEIFEPATTRTLMAALLVRDLSRPTPQREHPEQLFAEAAAHGGLWRVAYEPRSALGVAAVGGLPATVRRAR